MRVAPAEVAIAGDRRPRAGLALLPWALTVLAACHGTGERRSIASVPTDRANTVGLWLGGDVHLGQQAAPRRLFAGPRAAPLAGIGIVNLEGPVSPASPTSSVNGAAEPAGKLFNGAQGLAALPLAGVLVVGLANNHALDAGPGGPAETARAVHRAGLVPAGGAAGPALLLLGGLRVVVTAHDLLGGLPPHLDDDLLRARRLGEVLVATFHVTGPPSYLPRPELARAVELALSAGAQVVAAHGTHALGRVERRGSAVIAWGLGNLRFACDCTDESDALILQVRVGRGGAGAARVVPLAAGLHGGPAQVLDDPRQIYDLLEALGSGVTKDGWF